MLKDYDLVIPMYDLIEYSNNYVKTSGFFWQYKRQESADNITNSKSFKFKSAS